MKHLIFISILLLNLNLFAQKTCEYTANVNDSIGSYKTTKEYIVHERNFAGNTNYLFFSLALTDGLPTLNVQSIKKSKDFIKTNCLDKNSKIYLQLDNGKIITLVHVDQENCGVSITDNERFNNRITTGSFMFMKDSFADLKSSPVSFMRIKYTTETVDYALKKQLKSEMDGLWYEPATYFMDFLKCVEN
ncbi:MAG: hypothetical protein ABWY22_12815 [Flavobacterium sp.]